MGVKGIDVTSPAPGALRLTVLAWLGLLFVTFRAASGTVGVGAGLLCLLLLAGTYFLFRPLGDPFRYDRITILSFWFITYLLMIVLPAFSVYSDQPGPYRDRYLLAVCFTLATVPAGALCAQFLLGFRPRETEDFFAAPMDETSSQPRLVKICFIFLGILLVLSGVYVYELQTVPLFALLQGGVDYRELMFLREESYKLSESPILLVHHLVRTVFYPLLVLMTLGLFLRDRRPKIKMLFGITLVAAVLYASLTLAKAPVSNIFLMMILFWYYHRSGRIGLKAGMIAVSAMLAFPIVLFYAFFADLGLGLWDALTAISERLFFSPAEVVYYYFEVFPAKVNFLYGRSIGRVAWLGGVDYFNTPNFVGQYGYPQFMETINANGAFIADLNADFGLAGVFCGGLLAGMIMQTLHVFIMRRPKTVVSLACYAFLVFGFWGLNQASLFYILASHGTLLVIALAIWFDYLSVPSWPMKPVRSEVGEEAKA